jgi:hypothetical protein
MPKLNWVQIVGVVAILWNGIGVFSYLAQVGVVGAGGPPPGGAVMPPPITAAFAIGVFSGLAGSIALAVRSGLARPLLWLSFVTTTIDWVWVLGWSGAGSVPLGITVLVIALGLALLAEREARRAAAGH